MIDPIALLAFIPAGLALNLTPGADMMFCLGQGLRSGPKAAWAASAGISTGSMVHAALAGIGLGALVQTIPWAFDAIRWIGVGYLVWLAYQTLRGNHGDDREVVVTSASSAFRSGLLVNLSNPKVILFVLAFVPQFIVPAAGPVLGQFLIYGLLLAIGGFFINGFVGVSAGSFGRRLAAGNRWLDRAVATIFLGLAIRLALLERT